jgi:hypothetical protein
LRPAWAKVVVRLCPKPKYKQKDWGHNSGGRALAEHVQGSGFNPQYRNEKSNGKEEKKEGRKELREEGREEGKLKIKKNGKMLWSIHTVHSVHVNKCIITGNNVTCS